MIEYTLENDFQIPKIQNVVGTITLDTNENLKLGDIASKWSGSRYNKKSFSGLISKNQTPKSTYMLFANGKAIITGAKSEHECMLSSNKLIKKISKFGVLKGLKPRTSFRVHNVVATVNIRKKIMVL